MIGARTPVKSVFPNHFTERSNPIPTNSLYHTWFQRIQELRPHQRITQVRNFAWLMTGILQSRSVCLSRIASKIPSPTKLLSTTRPEDTVQKAVEDLARDIAIIEPDPVDWGWWVIYLLEQLQAEAEKDFKVENFEAILIDLRGSVNAHSDKDKWK